MLLRYVYGATLQPHLRSYHSRPIAQQIPNVGHSRARHRRGNATPAPARRELRSGLTHYARRHHFDDHFRGDAHYHDDRIIRFAHLSPAQVDHLPTDVLPRESAFFGASDHDERDHVTDLERVPVPVHREAKVHHVGYGVLATSQFGLAVRISVSGRF